MWDVHGHTKQRQVPLKGREIGTCICLTVWGSPISTPGTGEDWDMSRLFP